MPQADPAERVVDPREPDPHPAVPLALRLELGQRDLGRLLDQPGSQSATVSETYEAKKPLTPKWRHGVKFCNTRVTTSFRPVTHAFFRLFEGLPRQGPGSDACTREALRRLSTLPAAPRVLELGCGSGRAALVLAQALRTRIIAVDNHQPFLDQLRAAAHERGLEHLIELRCADMAAPGVPAGSIDLLWSEGALYLLGFENGLRLWRPLLAAGGCLAATECSWLVAEPPAAAAAFFAEGYPGMAGVEENLERARRAGFAVIDHFTLPSAAWWDEYYAPLEARIAHLAPAADPALAAVIDETRREIELYRRHGDAYGYVFYLLRRRR